MNETVHWLNNLAMVLGWAAIGTGLFFAFVGAVAWFQRTRRQGFPHTRRRRFL
jgi:hypothetical protein